MKPNELESAIEKSHGGDTADTPRYWVEPENWKPGPPYPNWCFVRAPDGGTIAWCTTKDAAQMIADAINRVSTTRLHVAVDDTFDPA